LSFQDFLAGITQTSKKNQETRKEIVILELAFAEVTAFSWRGLQKVVTSEEVKRNPKSAIPAYLLLCRKIDNTWRAFLCATNRHYPQPVL
jgi:hypothetical protein